MFHFREFRFAQRGACRQKAAGADGIDGSILVFSTTIRLVQNHRQRPFEGPIAQHNSKPRGADCLLDDCAANLFAVVPKWETLGPTWHGPTRATLPVCDRRAWDGIEGRKQSTACSFARSRRIAYQLIESAAVGNLFYRGRHCTSH